MSRTPPLDSRAGARGVAPAPEPESPGQVLSRPAEQRAFAAFPQDRAAAHGCGLLHRGGSLRGPSSPAPRSLGHDLDRLATFLAAFVGGFVAFAAASSRAPSATSPRVSVVPMVGFAPSERVTVSRLTGRDVLMPPHGNARRELPPTPGFTGLPAHEPIDIEEPRILVVNSWNESLLAPLH